MEKKPNQTNVSLDQQLTVLNSYRTLKPSAACCYHLMMVMIDVYPLFINPEELASEESSQLLPCMRQNSSRPLWT